VKIKIVRTMKICTMALRMLSKHIINGRSMSGGQVLLFLDLKKYPRLGMSSSFFWWKCKGHRENKKLFPDAAVE